MNGLDFFICIIVAIGLFRGVLRGLIKEIASIVGVFTGFYVALAHYGVLVPSIAPYIKRPEIANLMAFFLVFLAVLIGVTVVAVILKYILKITHLGNVDKVFGGVLGFIKGVLVCGAVVFALTVFLPAGRSGFLHESWLVPAVTKSTKTIIALVPKDVMRSFRGETARMKQAWEEQDG